MAAGKIGACWANESWPDTAWEAATWSGTMPPPPPPSTGSVGVGAYIPLDFDGLTKRKRRLLARKIERRPAYVQLDTRPTLADMAREHRAAWEAREAREASHRPPPVVSQALSPDSVRAVMLLLDAMDEL